MLFAFGSADLSATALTAIEAVGSQIGGGGGTVTIEGHTDAIGTDADNQVLSERRAAAVRSALEAELGGSFTYRTVGFGESKPVAPTPGRTAATTRTAAPGTAGWRSAPGTRPRLRLRRSPPGR